jgi:hypothetical protein
MPGNRLTFMKRFLLGPYDHRSKISFIRSNIYPIAS